MEQLKTLPLPIPLLTTGLTTIAYQKALLNRIKDFTLDPGGKHDVQKYTPLFLHDTLMLPGSLANLIGKKSSEDILKHMTPALLPSHHLHISPQTLKPILLSSSSHPNNNHNNHNIIQGMLLLGRGKETRNLIHAHYRRQTTTHDYPKCKRKKPLIEFEVMVRKSSSPRHKRRDFWMPERRQIWAYAWKTVGEVESCCHSRSDGIASSLSCADWKLECYLAGTLSAGDGERPPMRIEASGKGDEEADGYLGRDVREYDVGSYQSWEEAGDGWGKSGSRARRVMVGSMVKEGTLRRDGISKNETMIVCCEECEKKCGLGT